MKEPPPNYEDAMGGMPNHGAGGGQYPPLPQFNDSYPNYPPPSAPPPPPPSAQHQHQRHPHQRQFGPYSQQVKCPVCRQNCLTELAYVSNLLTWILFIISCLLCFCCCFVPLCMQSCKDVEHRCPECKTYLGTYNRMSGRSYRNPQPIQV